MIFPVRLIVDLNHLAYRNWAANATLATSRGESTGAIYGTLKSIVALSEQFNPEQIVVARDCACSFRRAIYPAYKAYRLKENLAPDKALARENFECQLAKLEEILQLLGIAVLAVDELEADDLAALVAINIPFGGTTILVSGDRDFIQLVRPGVKLFSPMIPLRGKLLTHDGPEYEGCEPRVWERMSEVGPRTFTKWIEKLPRGIELERWLLYRLVVGDHSDNLSGVPGIGPLAGLKITEHFSSFDHLKWGTMKWAKALNVAQINALEEAIASGDLDSQYRLIDLSVLTGDEAADELAQYLAREINEARSDEKAARARLAHWEMGSFLIQWDKFYARFASLGVHLS